MAVLWLLLTPLFLFARRFRVYRPVFAIYPAVSRAWWSLLVLLVAVPRLVLFASVTLPTWALWLLGIWAALQALCIPGVLLIRSGLTQAKRGPKPRWPMASSLTVECGRNVETPHPATIISAKMPI